MGVPSFLSYFKTLSIGPVSVIESATFRSAVKRSTDWANPDMEQLYIGSGADPGFFLGGGALVSSNKPHSFFAEYQLY